MREGSDGGDNGDCVGDDNDGSDNIGDNDGDDSDCVGGDDDGDDGNYAGGDDGGDGNNGDCDSYDDDDVVSQHSDGHNSHWSEG